MKELRSSADRLGPWLLMGRVTAGNPSRRSEFVAAFGSLESAAKVPLDQWRRLGLLRPSGGKDIFAAAPPDSGGGSAAWVDRQIASAARLGASIITIDDASYPEWLKTIADPPVLLHVRGRVAALSRPGVAVVGARVATAYGIGVAESLGRDLAAAGLAVVSGGARGIDSAAHRGALEAGGVTVAVMGSGLDVPYPKENEPLFERIADRGAVISEFPFGTAPLPQFFPFRNRIIAGLGRGVVVVEGRRESGSLITAGLAADFGREVFAVPGPITSPLSEGPNHLIQDGAKLVRRVSDILEEIFGLEGMSGQPGLFGAENPEGGARAVPDINNDASPEGVAILSALDPHAGSTADELSTRLGIAPGELLGKLLELELSGRIQQLPGGRFVRRG